MKVGHPQNELRHWARRSENLWRAHEVQGCAWL